MNGYLFGLFPGEADSKGTSTKSYSHALVFPYYVSLQLLNGDLRPSNAGSGDHQHPKWHLLFANSECIPVWRHFAAGVKATTRTATIWKIC